MPASKELMSLMQRIQRFAPPTAEPPKPSKELQHLLNRIAARKWRLAELEGIRLMLQEITNDLWFIQHVRNCEQCRMELAISIVRYAGRCAPWYLNIGNELGWPEIYEEEPLYQDCPRPWDYDMGTYWTGENLPETQRFIMDRLTWAEEKVKKIAQAATRYLEAVEAWDLKGEPPIPDRIIYLYASTSFFGVKS